MGMDMYLDMCKDMPSKPGSNSFVAASEFEQLLDALTKKNRQ